MFFKNIEMCFQTACSILNTCNLFSISSNMCIEYNKRKSPPRYISVIFY